MIAAIEAGYVKTEIVKDISHLGRDYLKVGYYTEIFFAEKDVRYIAINDGMDSTKGGNDFTPFLLECFVNKPYVLVADDSNNSPQLSHVACTILLQIWLNFDFDMLGFVPPILVDGNFWRLLMFVTS